MHKNHCKWNTDDNVIKEKQKHTDFWFARSADNSKEATGNHVHDIPNTYDLEEIFYNFTRLQTVYK